MPKKKKETASKTTLTPSLVAAIQLLVQQSTVPADDASPPPAEGLPDALDEAAPVPVASDADVEAALRAVADHAAAAEVHRHDLAKANAIAPVVTICTRATTTEHRNQAARALRMLAFNNPIVYGGATAYKPEFVAFDNAAAIVKAGGLEVLAVCLREGATLAEGWLFKGAFNLAVEGAGNTMGSVSNRLKPWNKRWFVLCDDGKLYYYKAPEDAKQAKVPIDMNLLSAVSAVNGPLEFELKVGKRTLRLKAAETAERQRWMAALQGYLDSHEADRAAANLANQKRYQQAGTGIRDVDQKKQTHQLTAHEGWLYRQDADLMRRWRKWWCVIEGEGFVCTLYESLRVAEQAPAISRGRSAGEKSRDQSREQPSPGPAEPLTEEVDAVPARISMSVSLPLAMVSVREARQLSVPYVFEVISPQQTIVLQAQSQEEMALWMEVLQNATATSLGCAVRTPRMSSIGGSASVWGKLHRAEGNSACADCGAANPSWASINLGAVVCLACAGVHRQLGVHISKVRSLELDVKEWSEPLIFLMAGLGNSAVNGIWQPALAAPALEGAEATAQQREAHIRKK